ncbi:O-antigen ligase family protein [Thalassospira povalilytica]|uniref:O-antigen ligase family protein n=1 Tax=Thalassospira povalilytica TaxID=732237 RepID=UPI001D189BB9|nr:O-antigen ligase family protein [Thalassospira povalilytica]MCC4241949.1 O-antigen ligase family protein [Thalassospira povalilytica]
MKLFCDKVKDDPEFHTGIFLALISVFPFLRIRINYAYYEFHSYLQVGFVALSLCLVLIFVSGIRNVAVQGFRDRGLYLILAWFSISLLSSLAGESPALSLKRLIVSFVPGVLIYLAVSACREPVKMIRGFALGLSMIAAISVCYAIIGLICEILVYETGLRHGTLYLFGLEFSQSLGQRHILLGGHAIQWIRFSGFFPNPNGFGLVCVICIILLLSLRRSYPRAFIWFASFMVLGIILSGSRSALLLLVGAAIYNLLYARFDQKWIATAISSLVFCLPLATSGLWIDMLGEEHLTSWVYGQEILSLGERGQIMAEALRQALDNVLIGHGFGIGAEVVFGADVSGLAIHSVILNSMVEVGLVGTAFLVFVFAYFVWLGSSTGRMPSSRGTSAVCLTAVLVGLFISQSFDLSVTRFHYLHLVFFFVLGALASLGRDNREKQIDV